jgi:phage baseplate assembly protein gpV
MSTTIVNTIQQIIRHEMRAMRVAELGLVEAVYPHSGDSDNDNYGCDVRLKDSELLLKRVPITTGHIGTVAIPNVGDLVLVTFDQGDVDQPIIVGRLYNDEDRPPLNNPDEIIFRLPLAEADDKTIKADIRNIQANDPPREILVEMPPKITLQINDGIVHATAGETEMKLDQTNQSGGSVTVLAGGTKIIMNQDGDVTIEAKGAMTLKAAKDITLDGMNINIKSKQKTSIDAKTQAEIKGTVGAKLEGQTSVSVQSSAITEIKGSLVKIN